MDTSKSVFFCIVLLCMVAAGRAASSCSAGDVKGNWTFRVGPGGNDRTIKCDKYMTISSYKVSLNLPNIAVDQNGIKGTWTMVGDAGFEVIVAGRKYFGYHKWYRQTVWCDQLKRGWSHDAEDKDWACYYGQKSSDSTSHRGHAECEELKFDAEFYSNSDDVVEAINNAGLSWTAKKYPQFEGLTREDFVAMAGGKLRQGGSSPKPAPQTKDDAALMEKLPKSFDWRNVSGVNYVSPVRDQKQCGSCYAFASMGMLEARARIVTKNKEKPVFSPQDIMDCNEYTFGCLGGWPYLAGGKYPEDFGVVAEDCYPYVGQEIGKCGTSFTCERRYATNYTYVGGYYGASNEARMMKALYENGPFVVSFWVYDDFSYYSKGIYHHKTDLYGHMGANRPYEPVNHAVLAVGWGENQTGEKYWIIKNSWSAGWGMEGYFWIRKGTDECAIESNASESFPIYKGNG